jgi:hypothetical protein
MKKPEPSKKELCLQNEVRFLRKQLRGVTQATADEVFEPLRHVDFGDGCNDDSSDLTSVAYTVDELVDRVNAITKKLGL